MISDHLSGCSCKGWGQKGGELESAYRRETLSKPLVVPPFGK